MRSVLCVPVAEENPYQSRLAQALEAHGYRQDLRPLSWRVEREAGRAHGLVHLHWLAPLFTDPRGLRTAVKLGLFVRALRRLRRRGVALVWTVHNLYEHERQHVGAERRLRRWLARHADALIVHGEAARVAMRREFELEDDGRIAVVPHGHYIDVYPARRSRAEARRALGLPQERPVVLFLGQVNPYKGVRALLQAHAKAGAGLELILAGRPSPPWMEAEVRAAAEGIAGLRLHLDFVSDEQVADLLSACDLFVLPHQETADDPTLKENPRFEILTSGSAVLAMSFARPCLAPDMPFFRELLGPEGAFLFDPAASDGLACGLRAASAGQECWSAMGRRNRAAVEPFGWDVVAQRTAEVYTRVWRAGEAR